MCISNAYLIKDGKQELLMENVEEVQALKDGEWSLIGLFGEEMRIAARINSLQLLDNKLLFEEMTKRAMKE